MKPLLPCALAGRPGYDESGAASGSFGTVHSTRAAATPPVNQIFIKLQNHSSMLLVSVFWIGIRIVDGNWK